ncbi:conserved hypothetical protein [Roseovarius sp. EC-HK134]|jgi:uncharacterized protein (DUF2384 family)|nr:MULTISPECIES: antitoxin Xre/MbcA/ParS toxin-binding domain-containing protein [unclassified Roseovarius]VVS99643.1 conserved hypothetical protein [Roseovarius sp. EC-HK134]VVT00366.1 conserved hypothetical protein [Roseovarius sp. EC-SD190]
MQPHIGSALQPGADNIRIPAIMDAFSRLAEDWELSTDEQITLLGSPGRSTFFKWKKSGGNLPHDTIERISHLLGIYKSLQIVLPNPEAADGWIKKPNAFFDDRSALDVMLGGNVVDIYKVREYLDAQRGG